MSSGFYKKENDNLICAPNFIDAPDYTLVREMKDSYTYPIHGWTWFDSEAEAKTALGITEPPYNVNGWKSATCDKRIVAPISVVNNYPMLLFDLTVVRKLQLEQEGENVHIYCNYIEPEHQVLIDGSQGMIYVENR